jgi:hypothetical protein
MEFAMTKAPYPGIERRADCGPNNCGPVESLRQHVDTRLDAQDERLQKIEKVLYEIDAYFKASKIGGSMIKWMVTVGAAALAGWAAFKGIK